MTYKGPLIYAEIFLKAKNKGAKIKEVAINHYPRKYGRQKGGNLTTIFKAAKELITLLYKFKFKEKFKRIKIWQTMITIKQIQEKS